MMTSNSTLDLRRSLAKPLAEPLGRRGFLKATGGATAGLVIGLALPAGHAAAAKPVSAETFNPFVRIAPDGTVTVIVKHLDKGQGVLTGLSTLVAEELDADWSQVRAEHAPADLEKYKNLFFGAQGTGGSTAIANSWAQYRKAGAAAKAMLKAAAAETWGVPAAEITAKRGELTSAAGHTARFGVFAAAAASLPVPEDPPLKAPEDFTLIGSEELRRLDTHAKTDGTARYTIDVKRPGMLTAVIARPDRFGASLKAVDDSAARAVKGVTDVVAIPHGVAVVARDTWAAIKGREALAIEWDGGQAEMRGSEEILADYHERAKTAGIEVRVDGDAEAALAAAAQVVEADFEFPFLAHAPMEPMNAVAEITGDAVEVWTGSQLQTVDHMTAAAIAGVPPEKAQIHTLLAGGSFGRRATPDADMVSEAVSVAKAIDGRAPVKVQWTREDDIRGGRYRPIYLHRLKAGLDADGKLTAWQQRIVGQSIVAGTPFEGALVKDGIDGTSVEGASNLPYAIPNFHLDLHTTDSAVPVLWWRSVGSTHTAYAAETFIDMLAEKAGRDPVEFRLSMLKDHPRHAGVLQLAADKANWGGALPEGLHRGIAVHESFQSYVAQVAEVRLHDDGSFKVERVVCAVDCGIAVNPDQIRAQMEGGIGYGLGAALRNQVTLTDGLVEQSNFHDYEPIRIDDMPRIEVHIVKSAEAPTGVGEPGTPVIAPALANALHAASGKRIYRLPIGDQTAV